jgi:hypothetical protein
MKKYLFFLIASLSSIAADAQIQEFRLSDSAYVSLLTCEPIDDMAYTVYGHTAVRINDRVREIDCVYNYGIFDFSSPNFLSRFTKGELNYRLGICKYADFFEEYSERQSGITEQILNLTKDERQKIFDALRINHLPENRVYLYNFLFDNCSTRPRILVEKNISGPIVYPEILSSTTFRTIIHRCNKNHRWLTFGIDLALGAPLDSPIGQTLQMFLPENLMQVFDKAKIIQPDGTTRNLVIETRKLAPSYPIIENPLDSNPAVITWLFFGLVATISFWELRYGKHLRIFDSILFVACGLTGCLLFFLSFISIHPAVYPNFSIIWAHPLHIIFAVSLYIKPLKKFANYYMLTNGTILLLFLLGWKLFPQEFNPAFFPIVLTLCIRSLFGFYKRRQSKSLKCSQDL